MPRGSDLSWSCPFSQRVFTCPWNDESISTYPRAILNGIRGHCLVPQVSILGILVACRDCDIQKPSSEVVAEKGMSAGHSSIGRVPGELCVLQHCHQCYLRILMCCSGTGGSSARLILSRRILRILSQRANEEDFMRIQTGLPYRWGYYIVQY